jgi:hypothetical protein
MRQNGALYGEQLNVRLDEELVQLLQKVSDEEGLKQQTAVSDAVRLWLAYSGKVNDVLGGEIVKLTKNGINSSLRILTFREMFDELFEEKDAYVTRMKLELIQKHAASDAENATARLAKEIFERKPEIAAPLMKDGTVGKRKLTSFEDWAYGEQIDGETVSFLAAWGVTSDKPIDLIENSKIGLIVSNEEVRAFKRI